MRDGKIYLDNSDLCFSQFLSEKEFLISCSGKHANLIADNAGYHTYQLKPHKVKGTLFSFLVIFFKGHIQSVSLTICEDEGENNYDGFWGHLTLGSGDTLLNYQGYRQML